ncbi:MAG TPA: hypothetical protein VK604_16530 [Bryobacteraceae bacterium]|nr:hypothetical protein [Bryobacteraceae bacterium]
MKTHRVRAAIPASRLPGQMEQFSLLQVVQERINRSDGGENGLDIFDDGRYMRALPPILTNLI